jgi:hypothetical protein
MHHCDVVPFLDVIYANRRVCNTEDLKRDTEYDPEGAEEFVALIRALRKESSRPTNL